MLPFGRMMLCFFITSGLFKFCSELHSIESLPIFSRIYTLCTALFSGLASICLVLWVIFTVINPGTLFYSGVSLKGMSPWLDGIIYDIPHFRIGFIAVIVALFLSWIPYVTAISLIVFILSTMMCIGRILLFAYGSDSY